MALTNDERKFVEHLAGVGAQLCRSTPPIDRLQSLVDRGYCKLLDAHEPIFHTKTGEVMIDLSEAGREVLRLLDEEKRRARPVEAFGLSLADLS